MTSKRSAWFLFLLFAVNALNFFDRQIVGSLGQMIQKEWKLLDSELGLLSTAFTLFYAAVGLPLGRLADTGNRTRLLAGGIFVWSLLTALSGRTASYAQLFLVRLGVGAGEAICAPAATSLIGDIAPPAKRSLAMSLFAMGLPVGLALSLAVAPLIAREIGWRHALLVAGLPGLLLAFLVYRLKEPIRGQAETTPTSPAPLNGKSRGNPYAVVIRTPTMLWLIVSGILHNFNMYALGTFLILFLIRYHEIPIAQAGVWTAVVYGLSGIPGLLIGGLVADFAMRRDPRWRLRIGGIALLLSAPLMFMALRVPPKEALTFALWMGAGCGVMYVYYSSVYPTIHDVIEPRLRGTAMAVYFMAMYVCGASFGPWGTGMLSDHFTKKAALAAQVDISVKTALEPFRGEGLHQAMQILPLIGLLLGLVLLLASLVL